MKVISWLQSIGIDITLMLAGMAGSVMMATKKNMNDIKTTAISVVSGTLSANYLTQVAVDIFEFEGRSQYGVAFLLGYFGLKGVEKFITRWQKTHGQIKDDI
jgi:hypothetical protein